MVAYLHGHESLRGNVSAIKSRLVKPHQTVEREGKKCLKNASRVI